jgi:glycine hydroxymethyltransferase
MLVDVMSRGVTGKDAEHLLDEIGVTVNKNQIPFDRQPPNTSSGIRIGTPAVTSRGMGGDEMREIAAIIADAIDGREDATATAGLHARVAAIAGRFPVPGLRRPT